jgi:transcriptional antiterminator NusG
MSEVSEKKWYVVRAVSGQEAKIKDYIASEITRLGYDHHLEDILVPTEKVVQIRNVIGFLGETKGGEPIPLRSSEVSRMLGKVDELALTEEHAAIPYTSGETIKVIDGPFNGFTGSIDNVNEEKRKLQVMVKIFGRKTPLELSYMQVEKI